MQDKRIQPITMGEYVVLSNKIDIILMTPRVETCIVVILKSEYAVGLGHFDVYSDLENALNQMIKKMMQYGKSTIKAQLIGGDFGFNLFNSSILSKTIAKVLAKEHIAFEHKHYSFYYKSAALASLYFISSLSGYCWPESALLSLAVAGALLVLGNGIEMAAAENYYDVSVEVIIGKIAVTANNPENSASIIKKFSHSQHTFFKERLQINVHEKNLKYLPVSFIEENPVSLKMI